MRVKNLHSPQGYITLELREEELRAITNLLYEARGKDASFNKEDYLLYSNLYTAVTVLCRGCLPDFELNLIKELRDKANEGETSNEEN